MADEKNPSKAAIFFAQHGEKVGLGVAAALLVVYLVLGIAMAEPDMETTAVESKVKEINTKIVAPAGSMGPPQVASVREDALNPYHKVTTSVEGDPWAMSYPTKFNLKSEVIKGTAPKMFSAMPTLTANVDSVKIDGVMISWSVGNAPAGKKPVKPEYFLVEKKGKDGSWKQVAKITGTDPKNPVPTTWTDTEIEPKTVYSYRVRAGSKEKAWLTDNGNSEASPEYSAPVDAKTLGIFLVAFSNPQISGDKPNVYVTIEKFDPKHGKVTAKKIQFVGDKIGVWPEKDGAEATGVHNIPLPGGRSDDIDMDTKWTIKEIKEWKGDIERIKCEPEYDSKGGRTGCKQVKEKKEFASNVVIYVDDEGKEITWYQRDPKILVKDDLCAEHGGKTAPTVSPDEAKKRKEAQAKILLEEADKAYSSQKWKDAAGKYDEARNKFADTEVVKKRKDEIEKRVKECRDKSK